MSCSCTVVDGGIVNFDPGCPLLATHAGSTRALEQALIEDGLIANPCEATFSVTLAFDPGEIARKTEPTAHREARFQIYGVLQDLRGQMERWAEQRIKELKAA